MYATRAKPKYHCDSQIVLAGGDMPSTLDGVAVPMWQTVNVRKGQMLKCGRFPPQVAVPILALKAV